MNMRQSRFIAWVAGLSLFAAMAKAQDSQPLGDTVRQQRQKKEQSKTAQGKAAKASKVITNEEMPGHADSAPGSAPKGAAGDSQSSTASSADGTKQSSEQMTSQIQAQKSQIVSLQNQIDEVNESIRFAPPNCVSGCVQWNEQQREKQQQVERMQAQLEEQKKHLGEMQESARKQGYGSSVYDP